MANETQIKIKVRVDGIRKSKPAPTPVLVPAKKIAVEEAVFQEKVAQEESQTPKPKIAIVSLTSCEGCQFALLDLGERFLDLTNQVELVDFRLLEDEEDPGTELDVVFVEGNPMTDENEKTLLEARKRSKLLVALGNCAAMGGIPEIKNYQEGKNTIKHVYKYIQGIDNKEVKEIDNYVKVDFVFPGCPITAEEFLNYVPLLLAGKIPNIPDNPVCVECKKKGNRCLLLDKKPCFGPMILGGCDAVCPSARMGCQGCRGLRPTGNVKAMRMALKQFMTDEEFENATEIYGLRDDIEEKEKKS
ncbi:MAG TPA: NADH:ubiquinone oxidoreductase [Candidatus Moranbacteria bacterium]|nr:NADH:ubiquinone oxidoreductase [Candidatus Moranbacteria bacterium]